MDSIDWWRDALEAIQSLITVIAIVVGGVWTYWLFVRQRRGFPRLKVKINPAPIKIPEGWILHTTIELVNCGSVLIRLPSAELRLRIIKPLPGDVQRAVADGYDPVAEDESEIPWPMLAQRVWKWDTTPIEIEPGENDTIPADFFVPESIRAIEFYIHVANARKRRQALGWTLTTVYLMPGEELYSMTVSGEHKRIDEQQRQHKQQKPQQQQKPTQPKQPSGRKPQEGKK